MLRLTMDPNPAPVHKDLSRTNGRRKDQVYKWNMLDVETSLVPRLCPLALSDERGLLTLIWRMGQSPQGSPCSTPPETPGWDLAGCPHWCTPSGLDSWQGPLHGPEQVCGCVHVCVCTIEYASKYVLGTLECSESRSGRGGGGGWMLDTYTRH